MTFRLTSLIGSAVLGIAMLVPSANADGLSISYQKDFRHGSVGVRYTHRTNDRSFARSAARHAHHARARVPGRYVVERRKVWVPGTYRRQYVAPIFETRYDACGKSYRVKVGGGYWTKVFVPGHYEVRENKRWQEGCWDRR